MEEKGQALISRNVSSVVIDNLCNQARGQNAIVACFYFDFAAQNEQSPVSMLGSLLKQLVFGLEEIPEEISKAYNDRKNAIGGQGPQISDILNMLQATTSGKRVFICIDALDECATEHHEGLQARGVTVQILLEDRRVAADECRQRRGIRRQERL